MFGGQKQAATLFFHKKRQKFLEGSVESITASRVMNLTDLD